MCLVPTTVTFQIGQSWILKPDPAYLKSLEVNFFFFAAQHQVSCFQASIEVIKSWWWNRTRLSYFTVLPGSQLQLRLWNLQGPCCIMISLSVCQPSSCCGVWLPGRRQNDPGHDTSRKLRVDRPAWAGTHPLAIDLHDSLSRIPALLEMNKADVCHQGKGLWSYVTIGTECGREPERAARERLTVHCNQDCKVTAASLHNFKLNWQTFGSSLVCQWLAGGRLESVILAAGPQRRTRRRLWRQTIWCVAKRSKQGTQTRAGPSAPGRRAQAAWGPGWGPDGPGQNHQCKIHCDTWQYTTSSWICDNM